MALIDIAGLTFGYDGSFDNVFEDVSIQIDTDWKLGFVGRNGRGKTTLLRLLMGGLEYRGTISAPVAFEYFPFDVSDLDASAREVARHIAPDCEEWELGRELSLLRVADEALDRPFGTLSNGERTKVLLAALFLKENSFLLIDEPTNHLDREARELVGKYLNGKRGFILVSHDRSFLDSCIDHVLSINKASIEVQKGNFSSWRHNRQMQDDFERAENQKLERDIRKLSEAARRTAKWSDKTEATKFGVQASGLAPDRGYVGRKAAKMMKRSKAIESRQQAAIDEKSKLLRNVETAGELRIHPLVYHADRLVELENVGICYGGRDVCGGVSFDVRRGDRIALTGGNGSGKTSLLRLIVGEDVPHTGEVHRGSGLIVSYVSQDTSFLAGNLRDFAEESRIDESLFKAILRKLDFSRAQFEKDMRDFSGGQKKKVLIARSLCEQAHLYIWDEPLNFIDVLSRIQIEELLLAHQPTILFVEHDAAFVDAIATRCVAL